MTRALHLSFRMVLVGYFAFLAAFAVWIALSPSDFWLFYGSFLFTVAMAYITMIRFSRELQVSTQRQISTLKDEMGKQLEHLTKMTQQRELDAERLTPKISVRIDEHPYFMWMKDYWICAELSIPTSELMIAARAVKSAGGRTGNWTEQVKQDPPSMVEIKMVKVGDIGIRGVFDAAEIVLHVVTKDLRPFRGSMTLSFSHSSWAEVKLVPV